MSKRTDEEVLRNAIEQVVTIDLTHRHGWREGTGWHLGLPEMKPDMQAGEALVQRGVLLRDAHGRLTLSEAALLRILTVAIDSAVRDLLTSDPPAATLPKDEYSYDDGQDREILISSQGCPTLHIWG